MKKVIACLLCSVMMSAVAFVAYAEVPISLNVNGKYIQTNSPPVIVDGYTLVPARLIVEGIEGYYVEWDPDEQIVYIIDWYTDVSVIELKINSTEAQVFVMDEFDMPNMEPIQLDVPAQIINGSTMVPVRFVAERLHCDVTWDEATRTVMVESKQ